MIYIIIRINYCYIIVISGAEISKEGYEHALSIKLLIYENPQYQYLRPNIYLKFGYGSFQDYFSADANIVFLDCGIACKLNYNLILYYIIHNTYIYII